MTSKIKILSGHELVAKGFTKIETTLPKVGLKDVEPNGSWLEQKQIQSALEARKHLIEVERIEKSGALSVAVWNDELLLAEVTQKVGGHWQFLGHNVGNQLYLYPEEALYLMEVNCLQLLHNDMKVSLQQAYTLLQRGRFTLLQYKVYASLSRLGYRLFRHEKADKPTDYEKKINLPANNNGVNLNHDEEINNDVNNCTENIEDMPTNTDSSNDVNEIEMVDLSNDDITRKHKSADIYQKYLKKLKNNRIKPCNNEVLQQSFSNIPSLLNAETVNINVPNKKYIPNNIDVVKTKYNINVENVRNKVLSPASSESNIYSQSDEVNGPHVRRIRHLSTSQNPPAMNLAGMSFPAQNNMSMRFFNFLRPPQFGNVNFFQNFMFQRPYMPRQFAPPHMPRLSTNFRFLLNSTLFGNAFNNNFNTRQYNVRHYNMNASRHKRRRCNARNSHLDEIKKLAARLKRFCEYGNRNPENIEALQKLIHTYNVRYKTKIILNADFDVSNEQNIVETITLEDDEPQSKRHKSFDVNEKMEHSLNLLKALAQDLRDIEAKGETTPKHRRAFTKALRLFNDTYNVEYYADNDFEIINSRHITVASSDSDCHVEEPMPHSSSKKLKNPFNIMKRLSETQNKIAESSHTENNVTKRDKEYSKTIVDSIPKSWLPSNNDFGRAEMLEEDDVNKCLIDNKHDEFLYDFLTLRQNKFNNWLDLKISFFKCISKAVSEFQGTKESQDMSRDDGAKIKHVEDKLKVIKTADAVNIETTLTVDFDVYDKINVQNFKKSKPPPPHFRIVCLDEQDRVPNGFDLVALNKEYDDNITIVFAIVGVASVSYLRMNPTDVPMYIPTNKI